MKTALVMVALLASTLLPLAASAQCLSGGTVNICENPIDGSSAQADVAGGTLLSGGGYRIDQKGDHITYDLGSVVDSGTVRFSVSNVSLANLNQDTLLLLLITDTPTIKPDPNYELELKVWGTKVDPNAGGITHVGVSDGVNEASKSLGKLSWSATATNLFEISWDEATQVVAVKRNGQTLANFQTGDVMPGTGNPPIKFRYRYVHLAMPYLSNPAFWPVIDAVYGQVAISATAVNGSGGSGGSGGTGGAAGAGDQGGSPAVDAGTAEAGSGGSGATEPDAAPPETGWGGSTSIPSVPSAGLSTPEGGTDDASQGCTAAAHGRTTFLHALGLLGIFALLRRRRHAVICCALLTGCAVDEVTGSGEEADSPDAAQNDAVPPSVPTPSVEDAGVPLKDAGNDGKAQPKPDAAVEPGLSVHGNRFAVDGADRFVLGVSYFSCLYAPDKVLAADFAYLQAHGVGLIRCWVNWPIHFDVWDTESSDNLVLIRADGSLDPVAVSRLENVISRAKQHGLLVDLTFNQDTPDKTFQAHEKGLVLAAKQLSGEPSLLFDMQNEASHANKLPSLFMSATQAADAEKAIHAVDPKRVVTASVTSLSSLESYVTTAGLDIAAYHCCRNTGAITDWAGAMATAAKQARAALGPGVPLYFQEPNRCGSGGQYADCTGDGAEFVTAAVNSKQAGAAAWVFHTTAGYDLRSATLESQLVPAEVDALAKLSGALAAASWGK